MSKLFAFNVAEEVTECHELEGTYDEEQQLWIGNGQPSCRETTERVYAKYPTWKSGTNDYMYDTFPDY